ncbi:MAG: hypothetical protein IJR97_02940 [Clostridia bacterium]|nr:hypothetical protein [Clostridia bacterium]
MAGFVPREKMSKKARREMDRERRKTWAFSPVTRLKESKKRYDRKRKAHDGYDKYGMGSFFPQRAPAGALLA